MFSALLACMRYIKIIFIFLFLSIFSVQVDAHPGRTDSKGGHTCRTNCAKWGLSDGEYHLHGIPAKKYSKPKSTSQSKSTSISTRYNRKSWPHWIDADNDCQNTRAEILLRDNIGTIKFKRNKPCNVTWGEWVCPYTGKTFSKASDVDIDHIVPLKHAYNTGGASWSREKKRAFANDPDNLLVVDDATNQAKGYKGPVKWKPPMKGYWTSYAKKWLHVKRKYGLSISKLEMSQLNKMMQR